MLFNRIFSSDGFSFFELLIVIIIIGVMGMIAMPQLHSMTNEAKLNGAVGELVAALEYARNLAVQYQRPFQFRAYRTDYGGGKANQFLIKDNTIESSDADPYADPPVYTFKRVYNPVDKKPYIIDFDDPQDALVGVVTPKREYDGVVITYVPGGGTDGTIDFYPDGHCSDPAGSNNTYVLNYAGEQKTITVDAITGRITVQ